MEVKGLFLQISPIEARYYPLVESYYVENSANPLVDQSLLEASNDRVLKMPKKLLPFRKLPCNIERPKLTVWDFIDIQTTEQLFSAKDKKSIKKIINELICEDHPQGFSRTVFIELMYNVRKFCINCNLTLKQSASVMSQIFLTYQYFLSELELSADKVYKYFKDFIMYHSVECLPLQEKMFSATEIKEILSFFCKVFIRYLPLIRFLALPNFALHFEYGLDDPFAERKTLQDGRLRK